MFKRSTSRSNWNLVVLVFVEEGKLENTQGVSLVFNEPYHFLSHSGDKYKYFEHMFLQPL